MSEWAVYFKNPNPLEPIPPEQRTIVTAKDKEDARKAFLETGLLGHNGYITEVVQMKNGITSASIKNKDSFLT